MIQNYEKHSCLAIFHLARKSAYKGPGSISELERHWELTKTNTSKDQLKKKKKISLCTDLPLIYSFIYSK